MRYFKKLVLVLVVMVILGFTNSSFVFAGSNGQNGCVPVYGGGVQCPRVGKVLINKTVRNPSSGIFVDNLGPSDPRYHPGNLVTFRLKVNNTGNQMLDKVTVTDKLPDFIDFTSGPGSYDSNSKTLTFDVFNLAGGTSMTFEVVGRVVHMSVLPADKSMVCVVNKVDAVSSSQNDHEESQFCVEKKMTAPGVPTAGPKEWILTFGGLSIVLTMGLYFRKKAHLV